MKTLNLTLKAQWYDMIESGEKPEEYRELKKYWIQGSKRIASLTEEMEWAVWDEFIESLQNKHRGYDSYQQLLEEFAVKINDIDFIHFFRGGAPSFKYPNMVWECEGITIGKGNPKWGAPEEDVFIIKLGSRV